VTIIDNRPKTLNNKFQIAGVSRYEMGATPAEALPVEFEDESDLVLVENPPETSFKRALKDRY
jgi:hypothetical protein